MTESTKQINTSHRRKYQWIGGAFLVALAALTLPWLLTPQFESIRETTPQLYPLPDSPDTQTIQMTKPAITQEEIDASREKLHTLIRAPISEDGIVSYILQVGAFKNEANAKTLVDRLRPLEIGRIYFRKEGTLIRVYAGPYLTQDGAETAQARIFRQLSLKSQIEIYDVREHGKS